MKKRQSIKFNPFTKIAKLVFVENLKTRRTINIVDCPIPYKCNFLEGEYIIRDSLKRLHRQYNYADNIWYFIHEKDSSDIWNQSFNVCELNLFPVRTKQFWDKLKDTPSEILNYKWKVLQLAYITNLEFDKTRKRLRTRWLKIKKTSN